MADASTNECMQHALPFRRCVTADVFNVASDAPAELIASADGYLAKFAAPAKNEHGDPACFHCGKALSSFAQMFGTGVSYRWGMAHGEATCSGCGWPARGMHYPKDADGSEIFSARNLFLAYHPDQVEARS